MKLFLFVFFNASVFLSSSVYAKPSCEPALGAVPHFDSTKKMFAEIFQFKQKYSHCLDGGIAEGIAAVTVDSLDKNWNQLLEINKLNKKDSSFKKFILTNIEPNVTGQENEVKNIISHATKSCPKSMKKFCKDLIRSCQNSLRPE